MSEIVVRYTYWMQVMHTYVHVETGLDVIFGDALVFELLCCSAMGV